MSEDLNNHQSALVEALEPYPITHEDIGGFMREFQVPASLLGLYPVARRLLDVLPLMHRQDVPQKRADTHMRVAEAISSVPDLNIKGFRLHPDANHPGAFRGLYSSNPLYCMLGHGCGKHALRRQNAVLVAAFIPAYWEWIPKTEDRMYLREAAGRAVRRMGDFAWRPKGSDGEKVHLPALEAALKLLPLKPTPVKDYFNFLNDVIASVGNLGASDIELTTLEFLKYVFAGLVPGTKEADKQQSNAEREGGGGIVGNFLLPLPMVFTSSPGGEDEVQISHEETGMPGYSGSDSGQVKKPPVVELIVRPQDPVYSSREDFLLVLGNRHRCEALALDNQMFWFSMDTLNPHDIACLLKELAGLANRGQLDTGVAYLVLALYAGLPRPELLRLRRMKTTKVDLSVGPTLHLGRRALQVKTLSAHHSMRLPKSLEGNRRKHDSVLEIRLPSAVTDLLKSFCELRMVKDDTLLFGDTEETIRQSREILDGINSLHGTRLTLNRVDAIRYTLMANFEDEAAAILGTGRPTDRGYEPATYSAWTHAALDTLIAQTTTHVSDLAGLGPAWKLSMRKENVLDVTAGSRLVPDFQAVQAFVAKMKDRIDHACKGGLGLLDIVAMHNAYVRYVYAYLIVGVGMRPVSHPFPHPVFVDSDGWALFSDKDDDSHYHTRLICLTRFVSALLRELQEHNRLLAQRLALISWQEGTHLLRSPAPKLKRQRSANLADSASDPRLFFLLDSCGRRIPISPSSALADLGSLGLKDNAGRHFLRTTLRERGCPDQLVRAMLGHWRIGEEPHGKFSSLDPLSTKTAIEKWVEPLLAECSWTVIRSPLWKN